MTQDAINLTEFNHPNRAIYILGAEDSGLPLEVEKACNKIVCIYGERSLNVAVAGSIVLYDRLNKRLLK
jgi:tRNA G18 (ribose-2'-O)-methylase SpoU